MEPHLSRLVVRVPHADDADHADYEVKRDGEPLEPKLWGKSWLGTSAKDQTPVLFHEYVLLLAHPRILARMEEALTEAARRPARAAVPLLAEYYHLGINSHLFERVNNSLLMAQVNHVLHDKELLGIPHGNLDHHAIVTGWPRFSELFAEQVRRRNPSAPLNR